MEEEHVIKMTEFEGHHTVFPEREKLWTLVNKSEILTDIFKVYYDNYKELRNKLMKKSDASLHIQIEWRKFVVAYARGTAELKKYSETTVEPAKTGRPCCRANAALHDRWPVITRKSIWTL